jgi:Xaa-Pro aminopeptidase
MNDTLRRLTALREKMRRTQTDLVAVGPGSHMRWIAGFHPHPDERPCLLLVGPEKEAFLMPALNAEGSRAETDIAFHSWSDDEGPDAALKAALAAVAANEARLVALDETMRADFAHLLLGALPGAEHAFTADTLGALRMRKDAGECAKLKLNAGVADRAMKAAFRAIKPGMTETELADVVKAHFAAEGASPAFWIVGAGPNGAFPHHHSGERKLQEGDAVVIDIGGRKSGYPSDITRMAAIGRPPEGYGQIHTIVEKAVQAALRAASPGVKAKHVDAAARRVIADAGYGEYFVHRTGHGMGVDGHEPGVYIPGQFGVRLEEIVILREHGPEILSSLPRDLYIAK